MHLPAPPKQQQSLYYYTAKQHSHRHWSPTTSTLHMPWSVDLNVTINLADSSSP